MEKLWLNGGKQVIKIKKGTRTSKRFWRIQRLMLRWVVVEEDEAEETSWSWQERWKKGTIMTDVSSPRFVHSTFFLPFYRICFPIDSQSLVTLSVTKTDLKLVSSCPSWTLRRLTCLEESMEPREVVLPFSLTMSVFKSSCSISRDWLLVLQATRNRRG